MPYCACGPRCGGAGALVSSASESNSEMPTFRNGSVRRSAAFVLLVTSVAFLSACTGELSGSNTVTRQGEFLCDKKAVPSESPLKRLTHTQYRNTLTQLVTMLGFDTNAILTALSTVLAELPGPTAESYSTEDQAVGQRLVEVQYGAAMTLGSELTADSQRTTTLVGSCATDPDSSNDAGCLRDFVGRFGLYAWRRPLSTAEVDFHLEQFHPSPTIVTEDLADLVAALLLAPNALYHIENGDESNEAETYALSAFELASRLSYHFWQTMPDQALFDAADDGSLLTDAGYEEQLDRVLNDPRTGEAMQEFFYTWLRLDDVPDVDSATSAEVFRTFAGDDLPDGTYRQQMIDEVRDLIAFHIWDRREPFESIFTTDLSFAREGGLASIYGMPPWDGLSEPPRFPAGERTGLLTRAALISTRFPTTRPVHKAVFIQDRLLCRELPPPPNNIPPPPELDPMLTTRQKTELITMQEGSSCSGCHTIMNPFGFATENYDSLGRHRTEERLFDIAGAEIGTLPVDTSTMIDNEPIQDGIDLTDYVLSTGEAEACFARHYFRFTFGRHEDEARDGCVLANLNQSLLEADNMVAALRHIAEQPEFRTRTQVVE